MTDAPAPGRKIDLPHHLCPLPTVREMVKGCDHDYNEKPDIEDDDGATWICTRCNGRISFDAFQ